MGKNKVELRIRRNYEQFSETTYMHGFLEVYTAKSHFWRIFWIIVVIGAIGITSYQVYRAIKQYVTQTSLSNIKPLESDIIYPPISVCYLHWISWLDWEKASSLNFTRESILYGMSFMNPIFSKTDFDETEAEKLFLKNMALQNISTVLGFYKRVAKPFPLVIGFEDYARRVDKPPFFKDIEISWKDPDTLLCYKVDGNEIWKLFNETNDKQPPSHPQKTIFNFSTQDFKFDMVSNYLTEEEYNFYMANWLRVKTNYWITRASDFLKNFTSMTFPYRVYPETFSERYVEISSEYDEYTIVMQTTARKWMDTETKHCEEGQRGIASNATCTDLCIAVYRRDLKGCLLLDDAVMLNLDTPENLCRHTIYFLNGFFGEDNSTSNTTSVTDYFNSDALYEDEQVLRANMSNATLDELDEKYDNCAADCPRMCEVWKYEFSSSVSVLPSVIKTLSFTNQTDVNIIFPSKDDILIVIEENSQTWEDFVGNVGGLLGIWTGASILSFIQLVYLCCFHDTNCRSVSDVCRPKKGQMKKPSYALPTVATDFKPNVATDSKPMVCTIVVDN